MALGISGKRSGATWNVSRRLPFRRREAGRQDLLSAVQHSSAEASRHSRQQISASSAGAGAPICSLCARFQPGRPAARFRDREGVIRTWTLEKLDEGILVEKSAQYVTVRACGVSKAGTPHGHHSGGCLQSRWKAACRGRLGRQDWCLGAVEKTI